MNHTGRFSVFPWLLVTFMGAPAALGAPKPRPVTWAELRAGMLQAFCAEDIEHKGELLRVANFGSTGCPKAPAKTRLQRAILDGFEGARSVLVSVKGPDAQIQEILDKDERRRVYADALLASSTFLRALLHDTNASLRRAGYACRDCPAFDPPPALTVPWQQFQDYVSAHVWPDPVKTARGLDGKTTPPRYSFHVCAGLNGVAELANPDPRLVQAAFVAGFDADLGGLARPLFTKVVDEAKQKQPPPSDDQQTAYLRRRMAEEVKASDAIRRAVCDAVKTREPVLNVRISPC